MLIDFTRLNKKEVTYLEFSRQFTIDDLRMANHASIDHIRTIIKDADDFQITFVPHDQEAYDSHAPDEDQHIGWSLAHLVLHVTASAEEGAAFGSILARGISIGGLRLRYEPNWRDVTTKAQVLHRLEESRHIRLAYLDTWPDEPHLDVFREVPEHSPWYQQINAVASILSGLRHEAAHFEQFEDVAEQARVAAEQR